MPLPRPTLTRRQIYRRRRITVFSSLAVVLTGLFYVLGTGLAPVPAVAASLTQPPALDPAGGRTGLAELRRRRDRSCRLCRGARLER